MSANFHCNSTVGADRRNDPIIKKHDVVNHPQHYVRGPKGIECIDVTKHMNFDLGNATKYIWRVSFGGKENDIEDLKKAIKYLEFEIERLLQEAETEGGKEDD